MQDLASLPELFSPGMLVRCVVSSLGITEKGRKSVKLSLNPKNVNKVLSAEALKPGMVRIWVQGRGAGNMPPPCPAWSPRECLDHLLLSAYLLHPGVGLFLLVLWILTGNGRPGNLIILPWRGEKESKSKICW